MLFSWRNDLDTRKGCFQSEELPLRNHLLWLAATLQNGARFLVVCEEPGEGAYGGQAPLTHFRNKNMNDRHAFAANALREVRERARALVDHEESHDRRRTWGLARPGFTAS